MADLTLNLKADNFAASCRRCNNNRPFNATWLEYKTERDGKWQEVIDAEREWHQNSK